MRSIENEINCRRMLSSVNNIISYFFISPSLFINLQNKHINRLRHKYNQTNDQTNQISQHNIIDSKYHSIFG